MPVLDSLEVGERQEGRCHPQAGSPGLASALQCPRPHLPLSPLPITLTACPPSPAMSSAQHTSREGRDRQSDASPQLGSWGTLTRCGPW